MGGKTVMYLAVFAACALSAVLGLKSDWNQAARDQILDIHNDYRRNEGGCQINKMEYDMELEAQAKVWAEKCDFEHEMIKGRGENLAYNTFDNPESEMVASAAQGWFDEKNLYLRGQGACRMSCHYTQLVWDITNKVGCYTTRCPRLKTANADDAWFIACFYTPIGNWIGKEPYATECETPCRDGQTEEDGLCIGEEIVACVDDNEKCAGWAKTGQCENNPGYMNKYCKKSCKICESGDEDESEAATEEGGEEGSEEGAATDGDEGATEAPRECIDDREECVGWAATGQCEDNPKYMLDHCRVSCKVCEGGKTVGECEDKNELCGEWAKRGHCESNAGYMLNNCRKACGGC